MINRKTETKLPQIQSMNFKDANQVQRVEQLKININ
jgi:hypothetical protein